MNGEHPTAAQNRSDGPLDTRPTARAAREEKHWPASAALLTASICPATTARRTNHVSLGRAYAFHWLTALLGAALIVVLVAYYEDLDHRGSRGILFEVGNVTRDVTREIVRELDREPFVTCAALIAIVVGFELSSVLLAVLVAPWGARDERMRTSVSCALRRTWLQAGHLLGIILVLGVWMVGINHASRAWWRMYYGTVPAAPTPPVNEPPESQAWQEYQQAVARQKHLAAEQQRLLRRQPWYIKHKEAAYGYPFFIMATWFLWGVFRAVGADRRTQPVDRPPMCDRCGYNLSASPMDGRCPECGEPVLNSLGPGVRPGVLWQHWLDCRRRWRGRLSGGEPQTQRGDPRLTLRYLTRARAWRETAWQAIFHPTWFGRQIQTTTFTKDHRSFLLLTIPLLFMTGAIGINLCYVADTGRNPLTREPEIIWLLGPLIGWLTVAFMVALVLFAAWLGALSWRGPERRNLLGASIQIAAYLSGYLVAWAAFSAITGAACFALDDLFREVQRAIQVHHEVLAILSWLGFNALWAPGYVYLVRRATSAARYANR